MTLEGDAFLNGRAVRIQLRHRRLAEELSRRQISQNAWAIRLGLDSGHLSKLVNGKRPYPSAETRRKLLDGLDLDFDDLFIVPGSPHNSQDPRDGGPRKASAEFKIDPHTGGGGMNFLGDLRLGFRHLVKRPALSLSMILLLAGGIAANSSIFTILSRVILQPLPFESPERLVQIWRAIPKRGALRLRASAREYYDLLERSQTLESLALYDRTVRNLAGAGTPERLPVALVSGAFFDVLGVRAEVGRTFQREEERPGSDNLVMISHRFWVERFASDRDVLGRSLRINDRPATIIGVLPPAFRLWGLSVNRFDLWQLTHPDANSGRGNSLFRVVARLRKGVELKSAQAELSRIAADLATSFPESNEGVTFQLEPLHDAVVHDVDSAVWLMQGIAVFVLLIICANLGGMLLARSSERTQEIAIRAALGAGRPRILGQIIVENLGLVCLGALCGLALSYLGVDLLVSLLPPEMPRLEEVSIDASVLFYTVASAALIGLLASLIPGLQVFRANLSEVISDHSRGSMGWKRSRVMRSLVVFEVAVSLVLLVGAGLTSKSLWRLSQVDIGFESGRRLAFEVAAVGNRYREARQVSAFFDSFRQGLEALPGVESVGLVRFLPLGDSWSFSRVLLEQGNTPEPVEFPVAVNTVDRDYFESIGIRLLQGRGFLPQDRRQAPGKVIISQSFARRLGLESEIIGRRVKMPWSEEWLEIVGVVSDVRLRGLEAPIDPTVYLAFTQFPAGRMTVVLRTARSVRVDSSSVRETLARIDETIPISNVQSLEFLRSQALSASRTIAVLASISALAATLLALLGLYAMVSFLSIRRSHEIGIRIAVGASQGAVFRLLVGEGLRLVFWGTLGGLATAAGLASVMGSLLFQLEASDTGIFGTVALLFLLVSLIACAIPARRGMLLDPLRVLREE